MYVARRVTVLVLAVAAAAAVIGCSQNSTTAPSTTTTTTTGSSLVSVASSSPNFVVGISGSITVKLAGSPTKSSSIKMDFGDSSATVTMSAVSVAEFPHIYTRSGTFNVTATVTEPDNSVATGTGEVSVLP
jgi:hypothetical protein